MGGIKMVIQFQVPVANAEKAKRILLLNKNLIETVRQRSGSVSIVKGKDSSEIPAVYFDVLLKKNLGEVASKKLATELLNSKVMPEGKIWMVLLELNRNTLKPLDFYDLDEPQKGMMPVAYVAASGDNIGLELEGKFVEAKKDNNDLNDKKDSAHRLWIYFLKYLPNELLQELKQILEDKVK